VCVCARARSCVYVRACVRARARLFERACFVQRCKVLECSRSSIKDMFELEFIVALHVQRVHRKVSKKYFLQSCLLCYPDL
jgi:hypothetical protein